MAVGHPRVLRYLERKPLTARRAGFAITAVTLVVTFLSGLAMWLVDREQDFPNFWLGLWWAVQTVTTVGYGDITPETVAGRVIAAVVMLSGVAFVTVVTAAITAAFVEGARRRLRAPSELALNKRLDEIAERLDRIETKLGEPS